MHTDGEAHESRTYRFAFGERDADGVQTVALHELTGDDARSDAAEGRPVATGATGRLVQGDGDTAVRAALDLVSPTTAAALVTTGVLSVAIFPATASALMDPRRPAQDAPAVAAPQRDHPDTR